ncbi:MAG: response regulator transcription factor [Ignavibacteriales bacterium]|nr:response regulator transcription factor [Ignavibacteriales bacterium]
MNSIKIAIVEDHDIFREGLILVLNQIDQFEMVFGTSNGDLFIDYIHHSIPDIVLMDINMPIIDGIETTKKALKLSPDLKIIALTMFSDVLHYSQMILAGAKGFVTKNASKYELQQAITEVYNGGNYFSKEILQKISFQIIHKPFFQDYLTIREQDVLNLVCRGLTSQEIAEQLFISLKTVEVHRTNIFGKAKVRNTAELIIWAIKTIFLQ